MAKAPRRGDLFNEGVDFVSAVRCRQKDTRSGSRQCFRCWWFFYFMCITPSISAKIKIGFKRIFSYVYYICNSSTTYIGKLNKFWIKRWCKQQTNKHIDKQTRCTWEKCKRVTFAPSAALNLKEVGPISALIFQKSFFLLL